MSVRSAIFRASAKANVRRYNAIFIEFQQAVQHDKRCRTIYDGQPLAIKFFEVFVVILGNIELIAQTEPALVRGLCHFPSFLLAR
jgi:hypothetical protein